MKVELLNLRNEVKHTNMVVQLRQCIIYYHAYLYLIHIQNANPTTITFDSWENFT